MDPIVWGPHLWFVLHIITFTYPENPTEHDKRSHRDFFINLGDVIPCEQCKKHYKKHSSEYPITPHLDNKADLIKWLIQIHNFVNISLGKPTYTVSDVINKYKNIDLKIPLSQELPQKIIKKKNITCRIIFFIIILLSLLLYWQLFKPKNFEDIF